MQFCLRSDDLLNVSLRMTVWLYKKGEMTLFSLHHDSNFLGLVPPALWRDPGHCAGSRRGETERATHPGKSEPLCGLRVRQINMHIHMYTHTHTNTLWAFLCAHEKINLKFQSVADGLSRAFFGLVSSVFGTSRSPPSHVARGDPRIHLPTMPEGGEDLANSPPTPPSFPPAFVLV